MDVRILHRGSLSSIHVARIVNTWHYLGVNTMIPERGLRFT
jgi:hypothetical protein